MALPKAVSLFIGFFTNDGTSQDWLYVSIIGFFSNDGTS